MRFSASFALVLVVASPALAQPLVPEREDAPPFHVSSTSLDPVSVDGVLVFFAHDLERGETRAVRVTADAVRAEAGPPSSTVSLAMCGGARWVVTSSQRAHDTLYEARIEGHDAVWSRAFPSTELPNVTVQCAGDHPVLGFVEAGELLTRALDSGATQRVRVWPPGALGTVQWIAPRPGVLIVLAQNVASPGAALIRFERDRETQRVELGRVSSAAIARQGSRVIVAHADANLTIASYSLDDLRAGPSWVITPRERASIAVAAVRAGPGELVAIGVVESWIGDGFVRIPQGPDEPDRYEPEYVSSASVRVADVARGTIGPALELGREVGGLGWLGDRLVVLTPVEPAGVIADRVQLRPSRLRRFQIQH